MHSVRKLFINMLMFSLIVTPLMRADDKKESFWDKPAHKALVITGAAACAVAIAMIAYSYNKKDVPPVTGNNTLTASTVDTAGSIHDDTQLFNYDTKADAERLKKMNMLEEIDDGSGDESDGYETNRKWSDYQSPRFEEIDDFELGD